MVENDDYPRRFLVEVYTPEAAAALGEFVVARGGVVTDISVDASPASSESAAPETLLGQKDFVEVADAVGLRPGQAARAYFSLIKVAQAQEKDPSSKGPLPPIRLYGAESEEGHSWMSTRREVQLDAASLRDFMMVFDSTIDHLNCLKARADLGRLYNMLGYNIGPKTVDFWREVVKKYFPDYGQVDTNAE